LGRGMRTAVVVWMGNEMAVEGRDLVLKMDSFFFRSRKMRKIKGSVKAIVWSANTSCASFHDVFLKTKKMEMFLCV